MSILSNLLHGLVAAVLHPGATPANIVKDPNSKLAGPLNELGSAVQNLAGVAAEIGESTVEGAIAELGTEAADVVLGSIMSAAQSKLSTAGSKAVAAAVSGSGVAPVAAE